MNRCSPAVPQLLFHGPAGELQPSLVEERAFLVGTRHPDQHRRGIGDVTEPFLALLQCRLCLLALRYVLDYGDEMLWFTVSITYQRFAHFRPHNGAIIALVALLRGERLDLAG